MGSTLICTTQTSEAKAIIRHAADVDFGDDAGELVFEHGQWWLVLGKLTFSVVDTSNGVDFEQV